MKFMATMIGAGLLCGVLVAAAEKQEWSKTEQLLIKAQKICPVSGEALDSMGGPVKAQVGVQTIFLCCKGCVGKDIPQATWTKVKANLAKAQGKCPVLGKPLPANPKSIIVDKRMVFVCCPPCTKKVQTDSTKYLAVVDKLLAENLDEAKKK